jgi:predicted RNA-binding protein with RPS1 domain
LPGSLVDVRPVRDTSYLEGKPLEFKVIKLDARRNNVVVSRRAVVEIENSAEREALLESLQEGAVLKGIVKNLTDYGAFVDLGGIDGLLHITDMAWRRVRHPTEVVNVGDEIDVKVLKFDRERNRVSLGLKQLGEDPWVSIANRYPEGSRLMGKVTNIADYGCFVEIEEGVEGLVHVSEMDWTNKNVHPSKVVQLGDEVQVMVLDVDGETALDLSVDDPSDVGFVFERLLEPDPSLRAPRFLPREPSLAETVLDGIQSDFDLVADAYLQATILSAELAYGDRRLRFEPCIDNDELGPDLHHHAGEYRAGAHTFINFTLFEKLRKAQFGFAHYVDNLQRNGSLIVDAHGLATCTSPSVSLPVESHRNHLDWPTRYPKPCAR